MPVDELERLLPWLRALARARCDRVVEVPGGLGLLHSRFPSAHDHNQLLLWRVVDAARAADAADEVLGGAQLGHRRLQVHGAALADALAAGLTERGYRRENEVLMVCRAQPGAPDPRVVVLEPGERIAAATAAWAAERPDWPPAVSAQLGARIETVLPAADVTFLAVRDADLVVARADLFVRDGVAQIEEVGTDPAARNRGLASALVREAVRRARAAGAEVVFLVADADDWPAGLYGRLGFTEVGRTASFARLP